MRSVQTDMDHSKLAFEGLVWPACKHHLDGGELMQMEGRPDQELASQLDMRAGIDGWQLHAAGMRGVASRVQVGPAWNTFTIRKSRTSGATTEFEKRTTAITTGRWLYPIITVQAYLTTWDGPIRSVGVARTADIIAFINEGHAFTRHTTNAAFFVVPWTRESVPRRFLRLGYLGMAEHGYDVKTVMEPEAANA